MKTVVIVEDGRVTVRVDDGHPIVVSGQPVNQPTVADATVADKTVNLRVLKQKECVLCGSIYIPTGSRQKLCQSCREKPKSPSTGESIPNPTKQSELCKNLAKGHREWKKQETKKRVYSPKRCEQCHRIYKPHAGGQKWCDNCRDGMGLTTVIEARELKAGHTSSDSHEAWWCRKCQAFTTHTDEGHPADMPDESKKLRPTGHFMPGFEKTPDELARIKAEAEKQSFDDQWNCQMCRDLEHFCDLHAKLNSEGKKPPLGIRSM